MEPIQFCLPVFLGIHRNPKQKEFLNSCEGFLRNLIYRKVDSSITSRLEAHAGFFRLLMKGILDPYVL